MALAVLLGVAGALWAWHGWRAGEPERRHEAVLERMQAEMERAARTPRPEPPRLSAEWIAAARAARRPEPAVIDPPRVPGVYGAQR
jgi:uncharacterized membrane protein YccC